jgi:hypothetical protein
LALRGATVLAEVRRFTLRATDFLLFRLTICALRTDPCHLSSASDALAAWLVAQQPDSFKRNRTGSRRVASETCADIDVHKVEVVACLRLVSHKKER